MNVADFLLILLIGVGVPMLFCWPVYDEFIEIIQEQLTAHFTNKYNNKIKKQLEKLYGDEANISKRLHQSELSCNSDCRTSCRSGCFNQTAHTAIKNAHQFA